MRGGADRVRVADRLNVAERLAEGRPAAEHTQSYVRACHLVGYQHPDLTAYPAQIHDWYGSEDGLDLHALDADCAQLRAAASVLMEALRMERSQVAVLAAAWTGSGADAAVHFVQRHCETGNSVVTEVRAAAQRCESLRDNLWQLVDSKVATAIAIDERALAQRPAWLAAAEALTTEGADRPTAVEVVRQQIQPYVDDDVRNDWLTTMRSTTAGVAASYDAVTDQLASAPRAHFEIPDDLGPGRQPSPASVPAQPSATAAITPAARSSPAGIRSPARDLAASDAARILRAHFEIPDDLGPGRQPSPASVPAQPSATAAITPRSNSRLPTTLNARDQPPAEVSDQRVSGLTGAVHYNEPRGYDRATLKLVFSMDLGMCLNRFTYDSKLAPSRPQVVACDSREARIRNDGFHANAPSCMRIDYELITQNHRAYYCLKYLVRVGYCYPAVTTPGKPPSVLLYAPSACDESLPSPRVATALVPGTRSANREFSRFVVTEIKSLGAGGRCDSASVSLQPPEEIEGPAIPPASSQLVCVAPK